MSFLLFGVSALHVFVLLLLFVVTLDKGWWVLPDGTSLNLWLICAFRNSTHSTGCTSAGDGPWLRGVQGVLVGALLLAAVAFGLFLWQLHAGPRGSHFLGAGSTQLLAGLLVLVGAGLYASAPGIRWPGGRFGHCFALAWVGGALALANGGLYLRLRKKH